MTANNPQMQQARRRLRRSQAQRKPPIHVNLPWPGRQGADQGAAYHTDSGRETWRYWRLVALEEDGTVLAWDSIGEIYTRHHDLTPAQEEQARKLAATAARLAQLQREGERCASST